MSALMHKKENSQPVFHSSLNIKLYTYITTNSNFSCLLIQTVDLICSYRLVRGRFRPDGEDDPQASGDEAERQPKKGHVTRGTKAGGAQSDVRGAVAR